jgi:hypothetical protein
MCVDTAIKRIVCKTNTDSEFLLIITHMGPLLVCTILLTAVIVSFLPSVTVKFAFILGSSKHGNARRASVDSN